MPRPKEIVPKRAGTGVTDSLTKEGTQMGQVDVYWQGRPELGFLECETNGRMARWANGKWNRVAFCHSEGHYVWL